MEKAFIILGIMLGLLWPGRLLAQITANPASGCAPLSGVQFTGPAGATNINWDFGNGSSSSLENPSATFTTPGLYNVVYTAEVSASPVSYTTQVRVYGSPSAAFRATTDTTGCAPFPVSFQDLSTSPAGATIAQWEWAFGDGGASTTGPNTSHTYTLPGRFSVTLKVTDSNGCVATATRANQITVSKAPTAVLSHNTPTLSACTPPFTVTFSAGNSTSNSPTGGGLTYDWSFGNGQTSTQINPPAVTYTANGNYTVRLTVRDNLGCDTTITRTVSVNRPVASFYAQGAVNDSVCQFVRFVNQTPGASVSWAYGDGVSSSADTHTYQIPGTYQVTMYAYAGGCSDDTTITIHVTKPVPDFDVLPTNVCSPSEVITLINQSTPGTASWSVEAKPFSNQNFTGNTVNVPHTLPDTTEYVIWEPITYNVTLYLTSTVGCRDSIKKTFTPWHPLTARFMVDTIESCSPLTVTFSDSSTSFTDIVRYNWHFGDGATAFGTDSVVTHTYSQPGYYDAFLVVENQQGCIDTSIIRTIILTRPPTPNFSVNKTVLCIGDTLEFMDLTSPADSTDTWNYYVDGIPLQNHCPNTPNASWVVNLPPGIYPISMEAGRYDCFQQTTLGHTIEVKGAIGHFEIDLECATPYLVSTNAITTNADSLVWDFGDGTVINTTTNTNPSHTYVQTGDYTITLTLFNRTDGCTPYQYKQAVKIRDVSVGLPTRFNVCLGDTFNYSALSPVDVFERCERGYVWDFADTLPLLQTDRPNIGYALNTPGIYTLNLYVQDENYCWDTATSSIKVYSINADITASNVTGCLPLTVNFADNSTSDTTINYWRWVMGDTTHALTTNTGYTYTLSGQDTMKLFVRNVIGCVDSAEVLINPDRPSAGFNAVGSRFICVGDSVRFRATDTTHQSYIWDFGDGSGAISGTFQEEHYYNTPGTYNVKLDIVSTAGCPESQTITQLVVVQGYLNGGFTSTGDTSSTLCYPLQISFTDTTQGVFSRVWNLGTGSPVQPIPGPVTTLWDTPGVYTVSLVVKTSFGCADTTVRTFNVEGPRGDFNLSTNAICKGEEITFTIFDTSDVTYYTWNFGDGYDTAQVSPVTHQYNFHPPSGQTVVSLVMWSTDSACAASMQKPVTIHRVIAGFERNGEVALGDTAHCLGLIDVFNNTSIGANQWNWNFGNGETYSGQNPPQVLFDTAGLYTVSLAVRDQTLGCVDTIRKTLEVFPVPDVTANGGAICEGATIELTANVASQYPITYAWTPTLTLDDSTSATPVASPQGTTEYTVIVTDTNQCADTASATVTVFMKPPSIDWDTMIVIGQQVSLDVALGPGYNYVWTPSEGLSCTNCPVLTARPLEDTDYTVVISDSAGCFSVPSYYRFTVKPETTIDVPTAFTPNGDGSNDLIFVRGWGIQSLIEFKIYNRWGQLVFETSDINQGWDGTFNGKPQNNDSYTYHAVVETWVEVNGSFKILEKTGSFSLVR